MSKSNRDITPLLEHVVGLARQMNAATQPLIEAQKDITKTIISLASAIVVFTITFSPSLIKHDTPGFWRYCVLTCWLLFVAALLTSLASLYYSMSAAGLPAAVMSSTKKFEGAAEDVISRSDHDPGPIVKVFTDAQQGINRNLRISRALFYTSMTCFGIALLIFTGIGVWQLLWVRSTPPTTSTQMQIPTH